MSLSLKSLPVSTWADNSLEIVWLLAGAILLTRFATWLGGKITARIDANARETDALVRSEGSKHRHAVASVITWVTLVVIYCATAVEILARLGVPLTNLVAPAAVVGVALGFGAQRIVQDLLAGFFIITERQYGYGDLIRLSVPGIGEPAIGTVQDLNLRVTTVRTIDNEVVITPNGQISQVTNLSRDYSRAVVDVPVPATVDVNHVSDLLKTIGEEAFKDEELRDLLLDAPTAMGVQSLDVDHFQLRVVARTLPGEQFRVGRMLRVRIAAGLRREGIYLPPSLEAAEPDGTSDPSNASGAAGPPDPFGPSAPAGTD
jgi:small conductance mechanosensitive channel